MKKFLSLTLVAVMLLSAFAFTSCGKIEEFVGDMFGLAPRTEITAVEWQKSLSLNNYTVVEKVEGITHETFVNGSFIKVRETIDGTTTSMLVDTNDGLAFTESSQGWVAIKMNFEGFDRDYRLSYYLSGIKYDELIYQEVTKSYNAVTENAVYDLYFENGVLVYVLIMPYEDLNATIEIVNVGKTSLERPMLVATFNDGVAGSNDAGKTIRTEITEGEWDAVEAMTNCTANAIMYQDGNLYEFCVKSNEKGLVEVNSMYGNVISESVKVVIDGYYYTVTKNEEGENVFENTGVEAGAPVINMLINTDEIEYSDLVYNAEERYYTVEYNGNTVYFYFAKGKLTKIVMINDATYEEIVVCVSEIGTTEMELPEYNSPVDDVNNEVDAEQWAAIMDATNYTVFCEWAGATITLSRNGEAVLSQIAGEDLQMTVYYVEQEGVCYCVENVDDVWVAKADDYMPTLGQALFSELPYSMENYTYDAELKAYVFINETSRVEVYFENGTLVSVLNYSIDSEGTSTLEFAYEIDNVGETAEIEVPEYTVVEESNPGDETLPEEE